MKYENSEVRELRKQRDALATALIWYEEDRPAALIALKKHMRHQAREQVANMLHIALENIHD